MFIEESLYFAEWNYLYITATKLLQKSGMRKNVVIDLIYRGFI